MESINDAISLTIILIAAISGIHKCMTICVPVDGDDIPLVAQYFSPQKPHYYHSAKPCKVDRQSLNMIIWVLSRTETQHMW
jgi:hypothetical protein